MLSEGFPTLIWVVFLDERRPEESYTIWCFVFLSELKTCCEWFKGRRMRMWTTATCSGSRLTLALACYDWFKDEGWGSRPPRVTPTRGWLFPPNRGIFSDKICISQFPQSRCVVGSQGWELLLFFPSLVAPSLLLAFTGWRQPSMLLIGQMTKSFKEVKQFKA